MNQQTRSIEEKMPRYRKQLNRRCKRTKLWKCKRKVNMSNKAPEWEICLNCYHNARSTITKVICDAMSQGQDSSHRYCDSCNNGESKTCHCLISIITTNQKMKDQIEAKFTEKKYNKGAPHLTFFWTQFPNCGGNRRQCNYVRRHE